MFTLLLPDNTKKYIEKQTTGKEFLQSIHKKLAKESLAYAIDDNLYDLNAPIEQSGTFHAILPTSPEGIEIIKHDTAHLLAHALYKLYPSIQFGFGPATDSGFYYDVLLPQEMISQDDFSKIEEVMRQINQERLPIERNVLDKEQALEKFQILHQPFKLEAIAKLPNTQPITTYTEGNFIDLCRGPHAPNTGYIKTFFKLTKISGSYWLGNQKNQQLQRISGIVFLKEQDLKDYEYRLEEAKKRDHRLLGQVMDLFHLQSESPGSAFFHPKGHIIIETLKTYMRKKWTQYECEEISTPSILHKSFWETSGHWEKFHEEMFITHPDHENKKTYEAKEIFALKPMSCPGHIQIFNHTPPSYKSLPIRYAEFGSCARYEPSGALYGIMRVRSFQQDDTHIFCTKNQVQQEIITSCKMLDEVYKDMGFKDYDIYLSTRPTHYIGDEKLWDHAERVLETAVQEAGLQVTINPGEGAFYGPKLEFVLTDALNRKWQCGTVQLDYFLPNRLSAFYINKNGEKEHPIMIHRAILGSIERFMGMMLEHWSGDLPFWLAPTQLALLTITSDCESYAKKIYQRFAPFLHTTLDISNNQISYKIRQHTIKKVPILGIIGKKEVENNQLTLRYKQTQKQQTLDIEDAIDIIQKMNTIKTI